MSVWNIKVEIALPALALPSGIITGDAVACTALAIWLVLAAIQPFRCCDKGKQLVSII